MGCFCRPTYKRALGLLAFPALLLYLIVAIGALGGVPGIWIESITGKVGSNDVTVKIGYFGMCLRMTDSTGSTHEKCLTSWKGYSGLSSLVFSSSSSNTKTSTDDTAAVNSLLDFASHMQHTIFVGSPAFFPGAGMLFLLSLLLLPLLSLIGSPNRSRAPSTVLVCNHITITSLWLATAWSFASALATLEAVFSQQEIVKYGACGTQVTVQIGVVNQCLQWIAFFLTAFFAAGMTVLRIGRGKEVRVLGKKQHYVGNWVQDVAGMGPIMTPPYRPHDLGLGTALSHAGDGMGDQENDADDEEEDSLRRWEQQHPISTLGTQHDHWNAWPSSPPDTLTPDISSQHNSSMLLGPPPFQSSLYPPEYEQEQFTPERLRRASAFPLLPYDIQPPTPIPAFPRQAAHSLPPPTSQTQPQFQSYPPARTPHQPHSSTGYPTSDLPISSQPPLSELAPNPPPQITIRRPTPLLSPRISTMAELHNWTPTTSSTPSSNSSSAYSQSTLQLPVEATRASAASAASRASRDSYQPFVPIDGGGERRGDSGGLRGREGQATPAPYPDDPPRYEVTAPGTRERRREGEMWQWPDFQSWDGSSVSQNHLRL